MQGGSTLCLLLQTLFEEFRSILLRPLSLHIFEIKGTSAYYSVGEWMCIFDFVWVGNILCPFWLGVAVVQERPPLSVLSVACESMLNRNKGSIGGRIQPRRYPE